MAAVGICLYFTDIMTSKDIVQPPTLNRSGRVAFDERGCAVWEWRTDDDQFARDIDTKKLKTLQDDALELTTTGEHTKPHAGIDPYNNKGDARGGGDTQREKRRSLDDMRRLNEQIKSQRR
jgi:hypothetical protein